MKLLIATYNAGKVQEYRELFADLPVSLTFPIEEGLDIDIDETGSSFEENAVLKAKFFARVCGLNTLADDSGLEVMALNGAPGIFSARYAGPDATDADRYQKLLNALKDVPWERRQARFRCVIAIATPSDTVQTTSGDVNGRISFEPHGDNGFGYDPVFYLGQYKQTIAELPEQVKNQISHRAVAAAKAVPILKHLLESG